MPTGSLVFQDDFASGVAVGRSIAGQTSVWDGHADMAISSGELVSGGSASWVGGYLGAIGLTGLGSTTEASVIISRNTTKTSPYFTFSINLAWEQDPGNYSAPYCIIAGNISAPLTGDHTVELNYYDEGTTDIYSGVAVISPLFTATSNKITLRWSTTLATLLVDDVSVATLTLSPARTGDTNKVVMVFDRFNVDSLEVWNADVSSVLTPTGFCSTAFGTPTSIPATLASVTGFEPTLFGIGAGHEFFLQGATARSTSFGTPYTPVTQTTQAAGFNSTQFSAWTYGQLGLPPGASGGYARGFSGSQFGAATVSAPVTCVPDGFSGSYMGTPALAQGFLATGFYAAQYGTPKAALAGTSTGSKVTLFGTPKAQRLQPASGFIKTRFGTPVAELSNVYKESGFSTTRFSRPTARTGTFRQATGFNVAQFGTPASWGAYRALHVPPGVMFGKPLLSRNILC